MFVTRVEPLTNAFDMLHHFWEHPRTERRVSVLLICVFLAGVLAIECNRHGLLPQPFAALTPTNHFQAVNLAFSMLLVLEVMSLIMTISYSVGRSMGKQFEILALILLRNSFKELSNMHEPITLSLDFAPVLHIVTSASAALVIFICLGFYYRVQRPQGYITSPMERMAYVATKKIISLALFCIFLGIGVYDLVMLLMTGRKPEFFETIYTVMIFADIMLVLVTQRFMPTFHAVFRNSGYVIATLFMRIALGAPPFYDAAVGIFAALYALALTAATTYFTPSAVGAKSLSAEQRPVPTQKTA